MARLSDVANRLLGRSERPGSVSQPQAGPPVPLVDSMLSGWFKNAEGELFEGFPVGPDDVVVDIGCGDGANLAFCAVRGSKVIGVDIDPDAVAQSKKTLAEYGDVEVFEATAEEVPLGDATATRVICTEVLEHVDDPAVVMAELVRVAAPGAMVLITCPDPLHEQMQGHVAPPSYFEKPNHIRHFERDELQQLVVDSGLQIIATRTYGFYWSIWWALFWAADVDLGEEHPVLEKWSETWGELLSTDKGRRLKEQLDEFLPMSQLVIARKPG